ncbi:MAG: hypothetical protein F4X44_09135 [Gammaproteobacteria bacterium]|nr:hypothetical protein [Gammaproteobacteria bacterium]MYD80762.1 hypothetical protein [Gammaproteobacteria bacterium]
MADRAPRLIPHAIADAGLLRELRASRPGRQTRGADDVSWAIESTDAEIRERELVHQFAKEQRLGLRRELEPMKLSIWCERHSNPRTGCIVSIGNLLSDVY